MTDSELWVIFMQAAIAGGHAQEAATVKDPYLGTVTMKPSACPAAEMADLALVEYQERWGDDS